MKTFEQLFEELLDKARKMDSNSGTVAQLQKGTHFIGKKIVEEAAEVWMAAEYEGQEKTAEEISQLLYHLQVLMIDKKLSLQDVYNQLFLQHELNVTQNDYYIAQNPFQIFS